MIRVVTLAQIALTITIGTVLVGCPATKDPVILHPHSYPPQAPLVRLKCAVGEYLQGGKHVWKESHWQWTQPTCAPRPATWKDGCFWQRGRWQLRQTRYVYQAGRIVCPR